MLYTRPVSQPNIDGRPGPNVGHVARFKALVGAVRDRLTRNHGRAGDALACLLLFVVALTVRWLHPNDWVNIDAIASWYPRINEFWRALEAGDWAATYRTHHPGVTLTWLSGAALALADKLHGPATPEALAIAKLPVIWVGALVAPVSYWLLLRLWGRAEQVAVLVIAWLMATEPLLVAHSRTLHLDMLVTGLGWVSTLMVAVALRERTWRFAVGGGALLGLAVLTKLSAAAIAIGIGLWTFGSALRRRERRGWLLLATVCGTALATAFALWPSLWVQPVDTVQRLYSGGIREAMMTRERVFMGHAYRGSDPGGAYLLLLLLRTTPALALAPLALGVVVCRNRERLRAFGHLLLPHVPLLIALAGSANRNDRYALPVLPLLLTLAGLTWTTVIEAFKAQRRIGTWAVATGALLLVAPRVGRLMELHPLPLTYCASWTGLTCEQVTVFGWGVGLKEAGQFIAQTATTRTPRVAGGAYLACMQPWLRFRRARVENAEFLVDYISERSRAQQWRRVSRYTRNKQPLFVFQRNGVDYVRVYAGPKLRRGR